jgi:hypothetical protein
MTGTNCRTRLRKLARKLQTEHPEGLSTKELFLASEDLLPAAPYVSVILFTVLSVLIFATEKNLDVSCLQTYESC